MYARFKNSIWAADLDELGWLSSKSLGVKYLLCVIDVFTKYCWFKNILWKMKKVKNVLNSFFEIVKKSKRKPKELWVDQGKQFFNSPMQKWLHDNGILLYSTHN